VGAAAFVVSLWQIEDLHLTPDANIARTTS
jgi:hypothetical protein